MPLHPNMGIFKEFKTFALRGSVIDLAVGVVIGAAFGKITSSLVSDVINPLLGLLTGNIDFSDKAVVLREATENAAAVTINYGVFINTILEFVIIAFAIFLVIKQINRMRRDEPAPEPTTRECPYCFAVVSKKASRCPQCTSEITPEAKPA